MRKAEAKILSAVAGSRKSVWELLEVVDVPLRDFVDGIRKLHSEGLIAVDGDGTFGLTERGKNVVDERASKFVSAVCEKCLGKRITFDGKFIEILEEYRKLVAGRPLPSVDFFQGYMREFDVVARTAIMHHYDNLQGKDFILIGDDDLLSVALALTGLPSRICVLDVDERLGEFLRKLNREHAFEIEFERYNVAEPLPEKYVGKFDVFSSEPLETMSGLRAFLLRGIISLKDGGVGYFGLTTAEASYKKWIAVERLLTRMNCVITDLIRGFSRYPMNYETINYEDFIGKLGVPVNENPGIDWYKSALFRFEVLGKPTNIRNANKRLRIKFVDEEEDITHPAVFSKL
ncbi:MAG: bis-aminopropyl spermidine synthase family protein [Candidatus Bathyarchaeia archaeon]